MPRRAAGEPRVRGDQAMNRGVGEVREERGRVVLLDHATALSVSVAVILVDGAVADRAHGGAVLGRG